VVMPDARGHGGSSAPPRRVSVRRSRERRRVPHPPAGPLSPGSARPLNGWHDRSGRWRVEVQGSSAASCAGRPDVLESRAPTRGARERRRRATPPDSRSPSKSDVVAQARARHPNRPLEIIEIQAEARLKTSILAFDVLTPPNAEYRDLVTSIDVPSLLVIGDSPRRHARGGDGASQPQPARAHRTDPERRSRPSV
jgi:N-formylmaleamate deformylase